MHRRQPPDPPVFGSPSTNFERSQPALGGACFSLPAGREASRSACLSPVRRPPFPSLASEIIQSKTMDIAGNTSATRAPGSGSALAGFFLSGFLLALLGAILPAWWYLREPDFNAVGNCFLSVAIGIVAAARFARPIILRRGVSFLLVFACGLSCLALLDLLVLRWILVAFSSFLAVAVVVLFQPEIRRMLGELGNLPLFA